MNKLFAAQTLVRRGRPNTAGEMLPAWSGQTDRPSMSQGPADCANPAGERLLTTMLPLPPGDPFQ